jgi:hypothetical protein
VDLDGPITVERDGIVAHRTPLAADGTWASSPRWLPPLVRDELQAASAASAPARPGAAAASKRSRRRAQ